VCIADEFVRAGIESHNSHDYLFGCHLATVMFGSILGSQLFLIHAPAALPSWTPGGGGAGRQWQEELQPWILPLCRYLAACGANLPTLGSLMKLADKLLVR